MPNARYFLALLLALAWPCPAAETKGMTAMLLVSKAGLPDPNFRDTVVLVTNSEGPGVLGVIINRRTEVTLASLLPDMEKLRGRNDKVYFGGPVKPQSIIMVFRAPSKPENAIELMEGLYMSSSKAVLKELLERNISADNFRVFAGYSGWAPGQLESELERGSWHLAKADARSVFSRNPETLWRNFERRAADKMTELAPSLLSKWADGYPRSGRGQSEPLMSGVIVP